MTPNTPSHNEEERIAELAEMLYRDADLLSLNDFIDALKNFRHSIESEVRKTIPNPSYSQDMVDILLKEERQKIASDLLRIADLGEYEDMRCEVNRYFTVPSKT